MLKLLSRGVAIVLISQLFNVDFEWRDEGVEPIEVCIIGSEALLSNSARFCVREKRV